MNERMLRVNSIVRHVLAEEIERLSDERLEFVTVTGVDTAPDLRHAIVYVDVLGEQQSALEALERAGRRLQVALGAQVSMKYTPRLEFAIDPAVVSGSRIDALLREIGKVEEE